MRRNSEERVVDPMSLVDTTLWRVQKRIFQDPAIFDLEMERIFARTWVYVGHVSELPSRGDYRTSYIGLQPVIIARDSKDELHVMINRCQHRGATVCQASSGNATFFRCEYHGWTYANDGKLVGVTYPDAYDPSFDRSLLGLVQWGRVEAYRGLIFATGNWHAVSLETHLGAAKEYIDIFMDQCLSKPLVATSLPQLIEYRGNWKMQLENGADGYHANFTHRSFMHIMEDHTGKEQTYLSGEAPARARALGNGHAVLDQRTSRGDHYLNRVRLSPDFPALLAQLQAELSQEDIDRLLSTTAGTGFNLTIFPNLQIIGQHLREIRPVAVDRTIVRYTFLSAPDLPQALTRLRMRTHELFYSAAAFGVPDDVEMFARVSSGLPGSNDEWMLLSRGLNREENGSGIRSGHISDEITQRSEYEEWVRLMSADTSGQSAERAVSR